MSDHILRFRMSPILRAMLLLAALGWCAVVGSLSLAILGLGDPSSILSMLPFMLAAGLLLMVALSAGAWELEVDSKGAHLYTLSRRGRRLEHSVAFDEVVAAYRLRGPRSGPSLVLEAPGDSVAIRVFELTKRDERAILGILAERGIKVWPDVEAALREAPPVSRPGAPPPSPSASASRSALSRR